MSEIREILAAMGVRPNRKLGQNFLTDRQIAQQIVDYLEVTAGDTVVEVGSGLGALTECLVGRVRRLILIEFDHRLASRLQQQYADREDVEVHHIDAVKFDVRKLWKLRPVKFLGNLPYSSGGAIMRNFLKRPHPFCRAVVMLQREVIERMQAAPGSKQYGVLSLRIQSEWTVESVLQVAPQAFFPRPAVDSSVALLLPHDGEFGSYHAELFDRLVRMGFAQRRKQVRKNLPADFPRSAAFVKLGLKHETRAEEISLPQWIALAQEYEASLMGAAAAQCDSECLDVVDENDVVMAQATRAEIHAQDLRHRAVHIFVVNRRGELLLQRRSMLKDSCPGLWDTSAAGHVDAGEDYEAAARREVQEELGFSPETLQEIGKWSAAAVNGWEHVKLYVVHWDGKVRCPSAEIDATLYLPPTEISAWLNHRPQDFSPAFKMYWKLFLRFGIEVDRTLGAMDS